MLIPNSQVLELENGNPYAGVLYFFSMFDTKRSYVAAEGGPMIIHLTQHANKSPGIPDHVEYKAITLDFFLAFHPSLSTISGSVPLELWFLPRLGNHFFPFTSQMLPRQYVIRQDSVAGWLRYTPGVTPAKVYFAKSLIETIIVGMEVIILIFFLS